MSKAKFIPHILAEWCLWRNVERQPEPDLIMDRDDQVDAYLEAGDNEGGMFAVHLFHAAHITQTINGARSVIDLGCGPATQLLLTARMNPDTKFVGVDLSRPMLDAAERTRNACGLSNVTFVQQDITALDLQGLGKFDAVTSTMAVHHLPTLSHLEKFFLQVRTLSAETGKTYLADLVRPKRQRTLDFMAKSSSDVQSDVFNDDFRNSMTAAFVSNDFRRLQQKYLPFTDYYTTSPMQIFMIMKSKSAPMPDTMRRVFADQRESMSPRLRQDLDDLRFFFSLGGLRQELFA